MKIIECQQELIWKPCFHGQYEATAYGHVRRRPKGRILIPGLNNKGYLVVSLYYNKKRKLRGIHQMIAEAFLGKRPKGKEVNHRNGIKTDNRVENLEYVTHAENCIHALAMGLNRNPPTGKGEKNPNAKLIEREVKEIRRKRVQGFTLKQLAKEYDVCPSTIDAVGRSVNWSHVT